jgi:ABC-type dipeptide/oligopeptide/nickel transport system permease subunit
MSARSRLRRLVENRAARLALIVIAAFIVAAVFGPMLAHYTGTEQLDIVGMKNRPPSWAHPFGTDAYSRDLLSRVLRGARISLAVAVLAVALSMTLGTAIGLTAGFFGGHVDAVLMRLLDAFLAIPRVLLLVAVLTLFTPVPLSGLIILLGATGWFGVSRLVRAETLATRREPYVEAARALGASNRQILVRHVLPNVATPVIVSATLGVGNVIALEAGLSFLGVGAHEPTPSWGSIFLDAVDFYAGTWWAVLFPGLAIVLTVLAFNILGDALRDVLDPRQVHVARALPEMEAEAAAQK